MRPSVPSRPLKVAIVAASLRILGGQAVQAQRMLDGWAQDPEVRAWLVPIDPVPAPPFDRLRRRKYIRTIVTQAWYWPSLLRELRKADIVHVFSASYSAFLLATVPPVLVARLLGKPIVLNYHSGEAPDHLRRSALARFILRRAVQANAVPSTFLRDVLASFGVTARPIANSIDLQRFAYRQRVLPAEAGRHRAPRLLSTRNLEPMYNVACTLRAFARVQARWPESELTIVGSGSQEPALRALAGDLALRHVTFAGRVPPDDMPRYYRDADIYVQTPSIDNMPLSVLEAFASGLPVVSTSVGGIPAILTDGVHGLLAPDDDDQTVAARILEILQQPEAAAARAATARRSCDPLDWSVVRRDWLSLYRAALGSDGAPPIAAAEAA
jgi:glycosyltransferase involved in cell wall biosynthesis